MQGALNTRSALCGVVRHRVMTVDTHRAVEFVDLTTRLVEAVRDSGVVEGLLTVQCRHTTAGLLINEHEPLLLADFEAMFDRLAPASLPYGHDDFPRRTTNLAPHERINGHAHCRAALLRTSECVPISAGMLSLGRWQRVFLVEFDGGQQRELWLTLLGNGKVDR
jgi:secondary thiamine-phosphate synthase enzyme